MIIVVDNFFSDNLFRDVHAEVKKMNFIPLAASGPDVDLKPTEDVIDYPGSRTEPFMKHNLILDNMIIRHIDGKSLPFTNRAYKYNQYAHVRLETDNAKDFIHIDNTDWAYLIYLSKTNLESGTKFYTEDATLDVDGLSQDDKVQTHVKFVQNRAVFFKSSIPHMAFNNHGKSLSDGRLTINGFCSYI